MRRRVGLKKRLALLLGVGIALVALLWLRRPVELVPNLAATALPCQPASIELLTLVKTVVGNLRDACAEFYWRPAPTDEFHNFIRLNNFGLHAPSYTLDKPPGVFRVLIVGDSFPQGMQVKREETFPALLQDLLTRAAGRQVEVINLSIDAFGTDRELLLYAVLGWQFQPDLVLLSVYPGNDIQDNQIDLETRRYGYRLDRPFFSLGDDGLHLHLNTQFEAEKYTASPVFQWLVQAQADETPSPPETPPARPTVISANPYTLEYPVELGLYLPEDAHWGNAWALTQALLLEFRRVVTLEAAPFMVIILPDRRAVHQADWQGTLAEYAALLPGLLRADPLLPGTRLEGFLTQNSIPALNLTPVLRAWGVNNPQGRLYYSGDGHFNPNGHTVTAQALAAWLQEVGLL